MKVKALNIDGEIQEGTLGGELTKGDFYVSQCHKGWLRSSTIWHKFSVAGAKFIPISAEGDIASAAKGGLIGNVLAGGLGAMAGAALSGGKTHSVAIHQSGVILVVQFDLSEMETLAALGVVAGEETPGKAIRESNKPVAKFNGLAKWGLAGLCIWVLVKACSQDTPPPVDQSQWIAHPPTKSTD